MSLLSGIRFISKDKREVKGISSIINNNCNNDDHDHEKNNDTIFKKRKSHKKDKVSKSHKKHKSKKNGKNSTDRNDKAKDMNHRRKRAYDSSSSSSDSENNDDSYKIDDHHVRTKYERNRGNNKNIGDNNDDDDDDDDDSVVDMNAIAREEEAKERVDLKRDRDRVICRDDRREDRYDERYVNRYSSDNYRSRHDANIDHGTNSNSNVTNKKSQFDADRFKSLINSLKNKNKIDMKDQDKHVDGGNYNDNIVDDDNDVSTSKKISKDVYIQKSDMNDCHSEKSRFFHDDNNDNNGDFINKINRNSNGLINNSDFTKQVPVVVTASTTTTTGTTNQSAAALLRERLKRNKMTTLTNTSSAAAADVTNDANVPTSQSVILDNKEMVTLQAKLQQLQEKDKSKSSSKSGNKNESNGFDSCKKAYNNNDDMDDMDEIYKQNILRLGDRYKGSELSNAGAFGSGMKTGFDEESDIDMKMFERKKERNPAEMLQRQVGGWRWRMMMMMIMIIIIMIMIIVIIMNG